MVLYSYQLLVDKYHLQIYMSGMMVLNIFTYSKLVFHLLILSLSILTALLVLLQVIATQFFYKFHLQLLTTNQQSLFLILLVLMLLYKILQLIPLKHKLIMDLFLLAHVFHTVTMLMSIILVFITKIVLLQIPLSLLLFPTS
jgi:hypothetical protein